MNCNGSCRKVSNGSVALVPTWACVCLASAYPVARIDRARYRIWALLTLTKMEELTIPVFKTFVFEETPLVIHSFLSFIFGDSQLGPVC